MLWPPVMLPTRKDEQALRRTAEAMQDVEGRVAKMKQEMQKEHAVTIPKPKPMPKPTSEHKHEPNYISTSLCLSITSS